MGSVDLLCAAPSSTLDEPQLLYINGHPTKSSSDRFFDVVDPMTGDKLFDCAAATVDDYRSAIDAANTAFKTWSKTPPSSRRRILLKAADILESYLHGPKDQICADDILSAEVSATKNWIKLNVLASANFIRDSASLATLIKGEILEADRPDTTVLVAREPLGVVFSICPWNAPLNLTARALATPLICGNTVILKPSEFAPKSQFLVIQALIAAGLPPGVVNFLPTSPSDAAAVTELTVKHTLVRHVNFTGSDRVGTVIAGWAASVLKPCIFELGGKAPVLVLDDADVEAAADAVAFGALNNSGQICMSTERVIVTPGVAETFTTSLLAKVQKIRCGSHYADPDVPLSGLYTPRSAQRIVELIQGAVSGGAQLITGNCQITGPNKTILQPHVLDYVTMDMPVSRSETFGPVVCIYRAADEREAIDIANQSDFSLCAAVFSKDLYRAWDVAKQVRAGTMHINGPTIYIEPPLPNGGTGGRSGYGRFGGTAGLEEFTVKKVISMASARLTYPF